jgi:acylphosphatase
VFSGPAEAVTAMIAACRRGPSSARVQALRDEAGNPDLLNLREPGERFSVLPTI